MIAAAAFACGFLASRGKQFWRRLKERLAPNAGWREIEAEGVRLRVPPDWGEVERDPHGGFVVHNRPKRLRVDGDAVWYSSAIELRILGGGAAGRPSPEAMTTVRRTIALEGRITTLELAIANGVGPRQRSVAGRALRSAAAARA